MARVKLMDIAIARSGDKGAGSNVGIMAKTPQLYEFLKKELTIERVQKHFAQINFGKVDRYELPNLRALNFILHDSLGGGGSESLKNDAQGKTHGQALLLMEIEVPDDLLARYPARTRGPRASDGRDWDHNVLPHAGWTARTREPAATIPAVGVATAAAWIGAPRSEVHTSPGVRLTLLDPSSRATQIACPPAKL